MLFTTVFKMKIHKIKKNKPFYLLNAEVVCKFVHLKKSETF